MSTKNKNRISPVAKPTIRKGDMVMVISGADKGKKGNVMEVVLDKHRVIVEEVNIVKKHRKPTQSTPGGIVEIPAAIHVSNVMLIDPKSGEPTRVGRKVVDGKNVRYSKKSGEIIK
ncbi:MAG TPA: 50S ribosomal protein L24 [Saprospiraceae bacterium]|nr:50S ribosomal protein L24 [Saprospiraceae bacterium]